MSPCLFFLVALALLQNAYSQVIGCNNGYIPNGLPPGCGPLIGNGLAGPYGYGDVAVTGELPVGGSTTVAGQVPVIGYVTFEGHIPAGGLVSVANNNCGCNPGIY